MRCVFLIAILLSPLVAATPKRGACFDIEVPVKHGRIGAFLQNYAQYGMMVEREYGVPFELVMATALLESGAGSSYLSRVAKNFHGRKEFGRRKYVRMSNDLPNEKFTCYDQIEDSFKDYGWLMSQKRYCWMRKYGMDAMRWANGVQASGYATGKHYAFRLKKCIKKYGISFYRKIGVTFSPRLCAS